MDFFKVFYAPLDVKYESRKWLWFFLLSLVFLYIVVFLNFQFHFEQILGPITAKMSQLPPEQRAKVMGMLTRKALLIRSSIGILFSAFLGLFFIAGVFYLVMMFFDNEGFGLPLFASSVYLYIHASGALLKSIFALLFNTFPFKMDLSLFVSKMGFLKGFLSVFDLFTIWGLVIAGIIMKKDDKKARVNVVLILLVLLVLWGVVRGLLVNMGVARMGIR